MRLGILVLTSIVFICALAACSSAKPSEVLDEQATQPSTDATQVSSPISNPDPTPSPTPTPTPTPIPTPKSVSAIKVTEIWGDFDPDSDNWVYFEAVVTSKAAIGDTCYFEMWSGKKRYGETVQELHARHFVEGATLTFSFPIKSSDKIIALSKNDDINEIVTPQVECFSGSHTPPTPPSPPTPTPTYGGVITTASGLQIETLVVGTGDHSESGDTAVVHYTGWLMDGTKFDSSVDRGQPFEFPLGAGRVIKGWEEGIATMRIGAKVKLIIPSDLAYGPNGAGEVIPPNATLIFEVELLDLK
jgi:hypothetical protein